MTGKSATTNCSLADFSRLVLTDMARINHPLVSKGVVWVTDGRLLLEFDIESWGLPEGPFWLDEHGVWISRGEELKDKPIKRDSIAGVMEWAKGNEVIELPQVDGPPAGVDEKWETQVECDFCGGSGFRECDMGHEHDCNQCCGVGTESDLCEEAVERVTIKDRDYARHYVWLINRLPGCVAVNQTMEGSLGFTFEGGRGVLQSMKVQ